MNDIDASRLWRSACFCFTVIVLAFIAFWYRECHEQMVAKEDCIEATHDPCQCDNAFRLGQISDCHRLLLEKP
jgi:hypothetical protein